MKTREQELETALVRLVTGLKGENFKDCEWYYGILDDAKEESIDLLR